MKGLKCWYKRTMLDGYYEGILVEIIPNNTGIGLRKSVFIVANLHTGELEESDGVFLHKVGDRDFSRFPLGLRNPKAEGLEPIEWDKFIHLNKLYPSQAMWEPWAVQRLDETPILALFYANDFHRQQNRITLKEKEVIDIQYFGGVTFKTLNGDLYIDLDNLNNYKFKKL